MLTTAGQPPSGGAATADPRTPPPPADQPDERAAASAGGNGDGHRTRARGTVDLRTTADRVPPLHDPDATFEHRPLGLGSSEQAAVAGVLVVPFVATGHTIVSRTAAGAPTIPGATRRPGESWQAAAARALLDDTGTRVLALTAFGLIAQRGAEWAVAWAEAEIETEAAHTGEPRDTTRAMSAEQAARSLEPHLPLAAELYRVAARLRANACGRPC